MLRGPCVEIDPALAAEVGPALALGLNALRATGGVPSTELLALLRDCERLALRPLAALSPAERRVADLVADGMSNPEIANHLYISRRTVETHILHACQKLEVDNRTRLALVVHKSVNATMRARPFDVQDG